MARTRRPSSPKPQPFDHLDPIVLARLDWANDNFRHIPGIVPVRTAKQMNDHNRKADRFIAHMLQLGDVLDGRRYRRRRTSIWS